jgi:peptidoglycan/LPS O-acetylase OafA/YrhL
VAASSAVVVDDVPTNEPLPRTRGYVDALTGLRGFAALVVLFVHASGRTDYPWVGIHGYGPVALFVLSGFLLWAPWGRWVLRVDRHPSLPTFLRRRVLRIFPAYVVVVLIVAIVYPGSQPNGWDGWLRAVTLTGTFASDGLRPGLEQTWSLGTELTWYLALPVIGACAGLLARRLAPRRRVAAVVWFFALALPVTAGWRWYLEAAGLNPRFTFSFWLPGFLVCFLGGAAVAHVVEGHRHGFGSLRRLRALAHRPWLVLLLAFSIYGLGNSPLGGPWDYVPATFNERAIRFACVTLLALLLLVAVVVGHPSSPVVRVFSMRWLVAVGRWSYGIYLWHLPVVEVLAPEMKRDGPGNFVIWCSVILAISVPLGAMTYAWVEKPAIAWSKRVRQPRDTGEAASEPAVARGSGSRATQ